MFLSIILSVYRNTHVVSNGYSLYNFGAARWLLRLIGLLSGDQLNPEYGLLARLWLTGCFTM